MLLDRLLRPSTIALGVAALLGAAGATAEPATSATPAAPTASPRSVQDHVVQQRHHEEDAHLQRLGIWALSSMVVGGACLLANAPGVLPATIDARPVLGFGMQSVAWGVIDLGIVGLSFLGDRLPPSTRERALVEENTLGDVLWLNVGLDAGYMMAGGTMIGAGFAGAAPAVDWASHGAGIVVQGGALLVLDAIALSSHPARLAGLWSLGADAVDAGTAAAGTAAAGTAAGTADTRDTTP